MISLAEYLKSHSGEGAREPMSSVRMLAVLLQALELHTIAVNPEDHTQFREELAKLQQNLAPEMPDPDLFAVVSEAIRTYETYSRQITSRLRSQFADLQSIVAAFTSALANTVSANDTSLARLDQIRSKLDAASTFDDVRNLKTHLCDCLNQVVTEVAEQRKNSAVGMERLAAGAKELEKSARLSRLQADPATGLRVRADAESVLSELTDSEVPAVAAMFVLKRLKQVNSRFGYEVGDGLLQRLATFVGSGANPEQGLYRWSGPALLAIITRKAPFVRIRQEIGRLVTNVPEYEVSTGARVAMIPMSVAWTAFPVTRPPERLIRQLEAFVSSQTPEDPYLA